MKILLHVLIFSHLSKTIVSTGISTVHELAYHLDTHQNVACFAWLPGFTGPVPPPTPDKSNYDIFVNYNLSKNDGQVKFS
jgi:hypothetical protein